MAEHGGTGTGLHHLAVDFHHHAQRFQIQLMHRPGAAARDKAAGGRVVGNHRFQVEFEIFVARVDHFQRRHHKIGGSEHIADMAAGAFQIGFGHKSQLGFDFRVDEFVIHNRAAVGHAEIVGQKAVARLGNAHLAHFRPRGEPHFHAHDFGAACFFAAADRPLNVKRILIIHIGKIIGDFGHFESLQFGVFQVLGQFCNLQGV